ncbi:major facilitator, sugar transporter-like, Major facilitator superfamily domain protein [Artemisia annua]|uniref:Major facilitator, sugar transporter-like, Major facilitator superfamily domain protein n=1 Tax=Artemisia annua TaxID=35608 RepID=A0A2U1MMT1_ARTAN|nr:major facilitator, sugar transporter-like, Major facilitator superfamily domain protein [Artemisia annua]
MASRDPEIDEGGGGGAGSLKKPLLHTGSWYRMAGMSSRQSSMLGSSAQILRESVSIFLCVSIIALGPIQFGFTCGYSNPTQADIIADLNLKISESLMIAAIPNVLGWLAISFARDYSFLYMGRLLEGFGVGVISYTVPVYIAEISPQHMRGSLGSVNQLSVTIGILLAYLLGLFLPWRALAVVGEDYLSLARTLPCILLIPGLFFIPESPRWLAKMGFMEDCETSLQVLRGFDTDITSEFNEIKRSVGTSSKRATIRFSELKRRRYWYPLMQLSGINGVLFYSSNIFKSAGISSNKAATLGLGAIQVAATAITASLVDKSGRRALLMLSSSLMVASSLLASMSFFLKASNALTIVSKDSSLYGFLGILSLIGLVMMVTGFSLGLGPIPWVIMSEILPVNIKSLAGSVATLSNWLAASIITMTAPLLLDWSSGGTFIIYAAISTFTLAFVKLWVPETKGKTLEEIQWSFR